MPKKRPVSANPVSHRDNPLNDVTARLHALMADVDVLRRQSSGSKKALLQQVGASLTAAVYPLLLSDPADPARPQYILKRDDPAFQGDETVWFAFGASDNFDTLKKASFWDSNTAGYLRANYEQQGTTLNLRASQQSRGEPEPCSILKRT